MIRFGIKLGLATSAAYYIADQGVWRSGDEATVICNKISDNVSPYTKEISKKIPYEFPSLPESNELSYLVKYYWNTGVKASFQFLADLPSSASHWTNKGLNSITESKQFKNIFNSTGEPPNKDMNEEKH